MRILYVAIDQRVPGTVGGSTHVLAVAQGLAAKGHEVHVATQSGGAWPAGPVTWHAMGPPLSRPELRWLRTSAVTDLAQAVGADVIMERYYNFGGEGVFAAARLGKPAVLEVNAPIVDHPGSAKARLDRALLSPFGRWRDRICRSVDLFVTPMADILPSWIDRARVLETEWGADVDEFRPDVGGTVPFPRDDSRITCVFAGAFRPWHGATELARAMTRLASGGDNRFRAVFIGDGPTRTAAEQAATTAGTAIFTGALPHAALPAALAAADIGVAPFDPREHAPLQLGFYWSPLKVFEYMAAGLPVVAPTLPRLARLISDGAEGRLYDPDDPRGLDRAIASLAPAEERRRLGQAARARAVREFSWAAHCEALDTRIRALATR